MDLSTPWLGLRLKNPLIVGASPMGDDLNTVRRLEDAGAAAIVLHSLFEEQILREQLASLHFESHYESSAEALSYFPQADGLATGPEEALMAGAHAVQMVSALLKRGPEYLSLVRDDMVRWLAEHGYESVESLRGTLSLARCPDPAAYERANYAQILQTWRAPAGW